MITKDELIKLLLLLHYEKKTINNTTQLNDFDFCITYYFKSYYETYDYIDKNATREEIFQEVKQILEG